jgi:hypothetical protein
MDKRIAALLGAAAALTAANSAQAMPQPQASTFAPAANYRELLDPIPNAVAALQADEAQRTRAPTSGETRIAGDYYYHHHHHHHHHRWWRRHYHHHHHHHHHNW